MYSMSAACLCASRVAVAHHSSRHDHRTKTLSGPESQTFYVEPETIELAIGETKEIRVWAFPAEVNTYKVRAYCSSRRVMLIRARKGIPWLVPTFIFIFPEKWMCLEPIFVPPSLHGSVPRNEIPEGF